MERPRTIAIIKDHAVVSDALAALLGANPRFEVVGTATSVRAARRLLEERRPDVTIADLLLEDGSAIDLLRAIREGAPGARVLVLTCLCDVFAAREALAAGAAGYVLKAQPLSDLIEAIEVVAAGRSYVSPRIETNVPRDAGLDKLTGREREILRLIVSGMTTAEIALRLSISTKTIDTHRSNMYRKLALRNTVDLVRFATISGIGIGTVA
jgi:DNA-binding NarL/FixJ family response regulator